MTGREELAQGERVDERQAAHLPSGRLGAEEVAAVDGALEAAVCCALAGHRRDAAGATADESVIRRAAGEANDGFVIVAGDVQLAERLQRAPALREKQTGPRLHA
jgi:hypothetical protein